MKRIYENTGFARRMNVSAVVVVIAFVMGAWELVMALRADDPGSGFLFAALFVGGGVYAGRQILSDFANNVVTFDADMATREASISIWRPFSAKKILGPLDRLSDWQFQRKGTRVKTPILTAHHPDHPQPLEFELRPNSPVGEELRALAPEAVAAFERAMSLPASLQKTDPAPGEDRARPDQE
jgi:hypothetical protein